MAHEVETQRYSDHHRAPGTAARPEIGPRAGPGGGRPGRRVPEVALLGVAAGVAVVVGRDGTPAWQVARTAVVALLAAATWRWIRRATGASRAGIELAAGLVGTAVGVGIGLPHLAKAGLHPLTVAGLVSLGGGLALVLTGGHGLVRSVRSWLRPIVVAALAIATAVCLLTLGQPIAATNVPRTAIGTTTPADRGLSFEEVHLETSDGVALSGWYVPSANGAAIALLHGAGSTRSSVLDHAAVLAAHGYGVLLFDARGHGRSGGRAMDFGWYGDEDATAAVSFLAGRPDVDDGRIALVGLSMGGEEAIGAGAADPRVCAVVAEGATNRVAADKAWLSDELGWRGRLQEQIDSITYGVTDLLTAADPPRTLRESARAMAPRPVLLVAAGDVADERHAGQYIQAGSSGSVELWIAPGADHAAALEALPEEWDRRVAAFLGRALDPEGC